MLESDARSVTQKGLKQRQDGYVIPIKEVKPPFSSKEKVPDKKGLYLVLCLLPCLHTHDVNQFYIYISWVQVI